MNHRFSLSTPYALAGLLLVVAIAWLSVDTLLPEPFTYFSFRNAYVQFSGTLGIVLMSAAMFLAVRPRWLETWLGGLDKMYRLHKWVGVTALIVALSHFWMAQGTKWMVAAGLLARPNRPRGAAPDTSTLEGLLRSIRGQAETVGEIAFYIAAVLLILALIKRFPYRWFQKTHIILAVTYLAFAGHAFVLFKFEHWAAPVGWLVAAALIVGVISALIILTRCIGKSRKVDGRVVNLEHLPESQNLEVTLRADDLWQYQPGQFAYVTFDPREGAHPFSIASAWDPRASKITFMIKALGDYTKKLPEILRFGDTAVVEGPYGCFTFAGKEKRQIWIGAGIGITPFLARLQHLAASNDGRTIDLFHPTQVCTPQEQAKLEALCKAAGVKLRLLISPRDGLLTGDDIRRAVPDWQTASLWFCGPAGFGQVLKKDFLAHGLKASAFRQESFEMR